MESRSWQRIRLRRLSGRAAFDLRQRGAVADHKPSPQTPLNAEEFVVNTIANQCPAGFTLITGGNSGIGLELARQAAADGRDLILVAQNQAALESASAELTRKNVTVHTISQDLSQPGAAEALYERVRSLGAEVDCLINNAGFGDHGPFATSDLTKQRSMIAVNITALTELTRLFLPAMLERGRGQLLNTASVTGFVPGPRMSVYFATKHYVLAFSEALIEELRGSGVSVTALCPPPVRTPFVSEAQIASSNYMATTKITPAEVARYGYRMMKRGKPVAIYGLRWKFVMNFLVRITPRFGLRRLLGHMNIQGAPSSQPALRAAG